MKKYIIKYSLMFAFLGFVSCETTDLDLLANPNDVTQDNLDPNFLFNQIQLDYSNFIEFSRRPAESLVRMRTLQGPTYPAAFAPIDFNTIWSFAYGSVLTDIQNLEPIAAETGLTYHQGVAKIMRAHVFMTLVDLFGDVPFSEALLGSENLNPAPDPGADVYTAALAELDAGIALLRQNPSAFPLVDFYYGDGGDGTVDASSATKWITAANTLKLRAYITTKLNGSAIGVDIPSAINALIAQDDLVDTADEDFAFQYGTNRLNPGTRSPDYFDAYEEGGGRYMNNYIMWTMVGEKGFDDPRAAYYFYRQDIDATDETNFTLNCTTQPRPPHYDNFTSIYDNSILMSFCTADVDRGYWGRDYGDASGIPPDNEKRTQVGLYPAGGKFDDGSGTSVQNEGADGQLGGGILPIVLSSSTAFMKAEAALTLGTTGDARALLIEGMQASFDKVIGFIGVDGDATDAQVQAYIDFVTTAYDAADNSGKLDILMKEWQIAAWGNGLDIYNAYRRTGFPSNMQPMLDPNQGDFYNTLLYPASFIETNSNGFIKDRSVRTFWDTNSFNLN